LAVLTGLIAVAGVAIVAAVIGVGGSGSQSFSARAAAICSSTQRALKRHPSSLSQFPAALQLEHQMLAAKSREISQLDALRPSGRGAAAFSAGLQDDRALLSALSYILSRPDYAQLAVTLPGHPELTPAWLKDWLARTQALLSAARANFARAGVPGCRSSLS
jgi:hypothetical protein